MPHLCQHLSYDNLLCCHHSLHNPESFIADEDLNFKDKDGGSNDVEVNEDDDKEQISNVHHLDVAHDKSRLIHLTGHHKWGECTQHPDNQSV